MGYNFRIMLKSFVAGIVVIVGLAIFVAVKDERSAQKSAQNATHLNKGAASAVADENHSQENIQDSKWDSIGWSGFFRWPNGTTAWAIILTLIAIAWQSDETRKAAESSEKQITLQSAALRQWVNVVPLGISIPPTLKNPCEITVQFEIQNKTDYLVTIKGVEFELIPNIHSIGKFEVNSDFPLVPRKSEDDSAFPFAGKCVVDLGELDERGKIFIVAGDIKFLDCMDREQVQHFQDLYRGFMDGRLEKMKPSSIESTKEDKAEQAREPN